VPLGTLQQQLRLEQEDTANSLESTSLGSAESRSVLRAGAEEQEDSGGPGRAVWDCRDDNLGRRGAVLRPRVPSLRMYSPPVILSAGSTSTEEDRLRARCQAFVFNNDCH